MSPGDREELSQFSHDGAYLVWESFERRWRRGGRITVEQHLAAQFLATLPEEARARLLDSLLTTEFDCRRELGETPTRDEYIERFPDHTTYIHGLADDWPIVDTRFPSTPARTTRARGSDRYRILREHEKGGFGSVSVALDTELNRDVALKRLSDEHLADIGLRDRFVSEAEITGALEHPGIVPIYSLGVDADARPYYAMRFVRGETLKDAIGQLFSGPDAGGPPAHPLKDGRRLAFLGLLRRFQDVCNAIEYAHSRGVLHRDIKPANIVLGRYGETIVLDWGLAKATGHPDPPGEHRPIVPTAAGEHSRKSQPGTIVGTPAYMSPEQARGEVDGLTPRSDVYCLGATLYQVLTGVRPIEGADHETIAREIAAGRFPSPRQRHPGIPRALEAVCLKAMAVGPADRYSSAAALAADIGRWSADEAVEARREPVHERAGRWMRRHRTIMLSVATSVLVATVGLAAAYHRELIHGVALSEANRLSEQRLGQVMTSYEEYFTGFNEQVLRGRQLPRDLLEALLDRPRRYYEQSTSDLARDVTPTQQERALLARGRFALGRIYWILGRHADAQFQNDEAINLYEQLHGTHPHDADYEHGLVRAWGNSGIMHRVAGQLRESISAHQTSVAHGTSLARAHPGNVDFGLALARSTLNLGVALEATQGPQAAMSEYRKAVAELERLDRLSDDRIDVQAALGQAHSNLGNALQLTGRTPEAIEWHRKGIELLGIVSRAEPDSPDHQSALAKSYSNLGVALQADGQFDPAHEAYRQAVELSRKLVRSQENVPDFRFGLVQYQLNRAGSLLDLGRVTESIELYRAVLADGRSLLTARPLVPQYHEFVAHCHERLGVVLLGTREPGAALEEFRQSLALMDGVASTHPQNIEFRYRRANALGNVGLALRATGQHQGAVEHGDKVISEFKALVHAAPNVPLFQHGLAVGYDHQGLLLLDVGKHEAAIDSLQESIAAHERLLRIGSDQPAYRSSRGGALNNLALALLKLGRVSESAARFEEAIAVHQSLVQQYSTVPEYRQFLSAQYRGLAQCRRALGQASEAVRITRQRTQLWPENPEELYVAAREISQCVPIAGDKARALEYAGEATATLKQAIELGRDDPWGIIRDPDLLPISDHQEFQALVARLLEKLDPTMPNGIDAFTP